VRALDLIDDSFPHGTPAGYHGGCRGAHCPAPASCRDVQMRYSGDYGFRKAFDAGTPVEEIIRALAEREAAARKVVAAVKAATPQDAPRKLERVAPAARVALPPHGTVGRYEAGCFTTACPATPSCADVNLARLQPNGTASSVERKPHRATGRPQGRPPKPHGTNASWARGCRDDASCPSALEGGVSCTEAHRQYHRDYQAARRVAGAEGHHGTPYGYQLGCKVREDCPAEVSCADASLAEERRRRREAGIDARELVDAEPVRRHVIELHRVLPYTEIGRRAGMSHKEVRRLVTGRDDTKRRGEIPQHTDRAKAERLLAVTA